MNPARGVFFFGMMICTVYVLFPMSTWQARGRHDLMSSCCAQDGDLQGEARASFESARAELMSLENGTREPTQTAWESARQTAQAEVGVVVSGVGTA